jgi:hypothetical protein
MNGLSSAILYGNDSIRFDVIHTKRKTMEIAVHPDKRVIVKAPFGTGEDIIGKIVHKRARWIRRQMDFFGKFDPRTVERKYIGGETHLYLGRRYRLKVSKGEKDEVKLVRGLLHVFSRNGPDPGKVKNILDRWYREKAKAGFSASLEKCFTRFEAMGYEFPEIHIRKMKTRWGSLSPKGIMTLNADLIRAPGECIDYVITHELCHQKFRKHGPEFHRLLEKRMPDWQRRKHKLEITMA